MSNPSQGSLAPPLTFGLPWPHLNDGLFYNDVVRATDSELTLIQFYSKKYKNSAPLQGWLQRIQNGQITIDGEVVRDASTNLRIGSELVYHRLPWKEPDAPHLLEILYEDDDMIALNKPSGLQVLPGGLFQQRTVLTQLLWWAAKLSSSLRCNKPHPTPVHRLGRGTSGLLISFSALQNDEILRLINVLSLRLLLCAKTKIAKTKLATYFADGTSHLGGIRDIEYSKANSEFGISRKILKIYRALVTGIVCDDKVMNDAAAHLPSTVLSVLYFFLLVLNIIIVSGNTH
ncbi:hypothetical protein F8388_026856 [Cannabis sativa]|uniref:Pseudouridine synthase RsuA/RluA-like domain-containing protein n=1 Tax=Cannabis sativa TaxID=3483 RepID=A0A7J6H1R5_CANSA|nr:hypothetical protein F8388_026856 [Cannabis sativa]